MTTARRVRCLAMVLGSWGWCSASVRAAAPAPPSDVARSQSVREEARRRFDLGLALYNSGDVVGALAEFQVAYELTGHPIVLYNLALVHAGRGHAVDAVEAFEKLGAVEGFVGLGEPRAETAARVYEEQLLRVGRLDVRVEVDGAKIQIDGLDVATAPTGPLRVTAGSHVVSVSAPGYEPYRVSVTVAGKATREVDVVLSRLEESLAHLAVWTDVPDVEVRAADEVVGFTPLDADLAFSPGDYDLALSREGYEQVVRRVTLPPGSKGKLEVFMEPTPAGLATGGLLAFRVSEDSAVVLVDGEPSLDDGRGLRVPAGRHRVEVQRAGFYDVSRDVVVDRGGEHVLDVTLVPTPEYLDEYKAVARRHRIGSYVGFGLGAGFLVAGGSFLVWNIGQKRDAERDFDRYADEVREMPDGVCQTTGCADRVKALADDVEQTRARDAIGWVGVGLGIAGVATGALLYAFGKNPRRYDPDPESDIFDDVALRVGAGQLELSGRFGRRRAHP